MNTGYGVPGRRRARAPLCPPHRAPPSSSTMLDTTHAAGTVNTDDPSTGKKRGWASSIKSGGLGSLPWEQVTPSTSSTLVQLHTGDPCQPEWPCQPNWFDPGASFPTSGTSLSSIATVNSSNSFENPFQQTRRPSTESISTSSFLTATDSEAPFAVQGTISSSGSISAQKALLDTSAAYQDQQQRSFTFFAPHAPALSFSSSDQHTDGPVTKKRRGLTGAIVDTALSAALYTGAAALTAYSMWTSWGRKPEDDDNQEPDGGPVVAPNKFGQEKHMPPGGLDEPPPPYDIHENSEPSTPRNQNHRLHRVFVSSPRNRRRPGFQTHRAARPLGTSRNPIPESFRNQLMPSEATTPVATAINLAESCFAPSQVDDQTKDDEDEDDMYMRFQQKMNALIAEGQAALESTPILDSMDIANDEELSASVGMSSSMSAPQFGYSSMTAHPETTSNSTFLPTRSLSVAHSLSHPTDLHMMGRSPSKSYLPEPIKRNHHRPTPSISSPLGAAKRPKDRFEFTFGNRVETEPSHVSHLRSSNIPKGNGRGTPTFRTNSRPASPFVFGAESGDDSFLSIQSGVGGSGSGLETPTRVGNARISTVASPLASSSSLIPTPSRFGFAGTPSPNHGVSRIPTRSSSAKRTVGYAPR